MFLISKIVVPFSSFPPPPSNIGIRKYLFIAFKLHCLVCCPSFQRRQPEEPHLPIVAGARGPGGRAALLLFFIFFSAPRRSEAKCGLLATAACL